MNTQQQPSSNFFQSKEEIEEILLQQLESLFDKPYLVIDQGEQIIKSGQVKIGTSQIQQSFKISYEKDYSNTFLITNPVAIFKVLEKTSFLMLSEHSQLLILDRLDDILQKCYHNSHILTDHITLLNMSRYNQNVIKALAEKDQNTQDSQFQQLQSSPSKYSTYQDIVLLIIELCLKLAIKSPDTTKKLIDIIRKLTQGKRFLRCHIEYIYQYIKYRSAKKYQKGKSKEALDIIDIGIKILLQLFEQRYEMGPLNYFYFSGYLSGIQANTTDIQHYPFAKGFAAALWFQVSDYILQDDKNLPVLFNCYSQGFGGFECYFNQRKLFYRILPKNYTQPNTESNGMLIGEFQPKKWYFLAIEHEKPHFSRPQLLVIINDKQVLNIPMDFPKIEKGAKLTMLNICKNYVGCLSSFMLFREQINNPKKFIQLYKTYEYGLYSNSQLKAINTEIFDQKLTDKLLLFYCAERTNNKIVFDCIEQNQGELLVNSGVLLNGPKNKMFHCGGLNTILPILELTQKICSSLDQQQNSLDNTINEYLKLANAIISSKSYSQFEAENSNFFNLLFLLLTKLPKTAVNNQTIQLLAEIRFQIGDSKLQEQFFQNLLFSSDFWINTDNIEVINEYWSFVKAIYSQNPVQYNKLFSIQNLIDLMERISDIKDGHCCEYHKNTFLLFYQGQASTSIQTEAKTGKLSSSSLMISQQHSSQLKDLNIRNKQASQDRIFLSSHQKIYNIEKYLVPIAGVLEGVLTSGGDEILDQIQHIAKSLTVKSSPCFHLQMLKLLKVLLLDSKEDTHCAKPSDFAAHFLNAKGLNILLYLCSNSSFDVKSMCVKLIDVLSSHTNLIKVRIDTDLITYLSNIILPKQVLDSGNMQQTQIHQGILGNETQQTLNANQYQLVEEEDQHLSDEQNLFDLNKQSQQNFNQQMQFGKGLFIDNEQEDEDEKQKQLSKEQYSQQSNDDEIEIILPTKKKQNQITVIEEEDDILDSDRLQQKNDHGTRNKQAKFDFEVPNKKKFNQTSKHVFGSKNKLSIQELEDQENEDQQQEEEQVDKKKFMNTQSFGRNKGGGGSFFKSKGLELDLPEEKELKSFNKKRTNLMFEEEEEEKIQSNNEEDLSLFGNKSKKDKTSFANENVMSKSNLRQPKSFNFGFSDDENEDDSQQQQQQKEEVKEQQKPIGKKKQILLMQKPEIKGSKMKKPNLFLSNNDDVEETKEQEEKGQSKLIIGTTGATNETHFDTSYSSEKSATKLKTIPSFAKNKNFNLNIDTDAINELFTYGGEKGQLNLTEAQEEEVFEAEIDEIATLCLAAMERESTEQAIEYEHQDSKIIKSTFESRYLSNEGLGNQQDKKDINPRKQFMAPQSVRGIRKIGFELAQEEKKSKQKNFQAIIEESSPMATSKSSSSKQDYLFGDTNTLSNSELFKDHNLQLGDESNQFNKKDLKSQTMAFSQIKQSSLNFTSSDQSDLKKSSDAILLKQFENTNDLIERKEINQNQDSVDSYSKELENLYTSCLEWIISRAPSSLYQNIVIDEVDKIQFTPALSLLMTLVTYSNNFVRQKALLDLHMLASARWDSHNSTSILFHPQFHHWLLDLLMPYQDLAASYSNINSQALAVYDIGCKLHTLLMKTACLNPEEDAYKRLNFIARWPEIVKTQVDKGQRGRQERDVDTAHKLARYLLVHLLKSIKEEAVRSRPQVSQNYPGWKNILHLTNLIEELAFSSNQKQLTRESIKHEQIRDVNSSIFSWIQQDFLLYYNGSNDRTLWAEWDLLESLFQTLDPIFPDSFFKRTKNKGNEFQTTEENIYFLLEKSSADEFNLDIEILMYEGKQTNNQLQNLPQPNHQHSKSKANPLVSALSQQNTQTPLNQAATALTQSNQNQEETVMKNILNLLCIALTQADTKQLVQVWLDRFERFVKFLMIVAETWKSRNLTYYNQVQKKFSESLTFAFTFLFHEIHSTNRPIIYNFIFSSIETLHFKNIHIVTTPTSQSQQNMTQAQMSIPSPKEQVFGKLFANTLKNIMVYFITIIEYSKIKFTPTQLEQNIHVSACRNIFHNVLVKNYSQGQVENLMSYKDISRYKMSEYEDFPESFYMDDWKVTFFYSEIIKKIVKRQVNYETIESYIQKRKAYANHILEMQNRTEKTKEDILKRMQGDILEVLGQLGEIEFERKNKVALLNENFQREQNNNWKQTKKNIYGSRGVWKNLNEKFFKTSLYRTSDGIKPILKDRDHNSFEYLKVSEDIERKIFKEVVKNDQESLMISNDISIEKKKKKNINDLIEHQEEYLQLKNQQDDEDEDELSQEMEYHEIDEQQDHKIVFFQKMLTTREKLSLKQTYLNHLKEYLFTTRPKTKEIMELKCSIFKPLYQREGTILLTTNEIIFFDDLSVPTQNQEKDNIFFFKYHKEEDELLYKIEPLFNIKEIQKRRFLGRKSALEIFLMDNKTIFLNFQSEEERNEFAKKILRQRNSKCSNLKYYHSLDSRKILKKRELTEKWMQWKISNFEYLMHLNFLAGRSYNDLSQYPVFPWILIDFTSAIAPDLQSTNGGLGAAPPGGFRDLTKNMQLLGSAERQTEFLRKYEDSDSFITVNDRFHCGSHYSNPGIVLHYLSRLSPYIDANVELHGKSLDKPDRCFLSVQDSLLSALNDHSDVRELIPEFYFLPELFMNLNKVNFGIRQDGREVNNVVLPQWCNGDPYLFVIYMREAMESPYVSQNLCSWIDYIFGYKQRDVEAERSLNVFSILTYEDGIDLDSLNDELLAKSYQLQIYNYGQTPSQLFQKKQQHPTRLTRSQALKYNLVVDIGAKIKVYKPVSQQQQIQQKGGLNQVKSLICNEAILKAKFIDDGMIMGVSKDGTVTQFIWISKAHELNPHTPFTCCEDKKKKFDSRTKHNGIEMYDRSIKKFDFPLVIMNSAKCILKGGYWDGKISLCSIDGQGNHESYQSLNVHSSTVTCIVHSSNERIVISGCKNGDVAIWNYNANNGQEPLWQLRKHISDHEGQIASININEDMCLYATSSYDGSVNLYNLWNDKLIRTYYHPNLSPIYSVIISQTPLPSVCFYSREDHYWHSFSINGHFLEKQREDCSHIIQPQIVKDSYFTDKLVYGTEKGYIIMRQLPLLKLIKKLQISSNHPVLSVIVSPDRRFLLVGCGDGGLNVITEPNMITIPQVKQQQTTNPSTSTMNPSSVMISTQSDKSQSSNQFNTQYRE